MNTLSDLFSSVATLNQPFESPEARKEAVTGVRNDLQTFVASNPENGHAIYFLGIAETILGNSTAAIEHFKKVLRLGSQQALSAEVYYNLGVALADIGKTEEAQSAFAVAKDLTDDPMLRELAARMLQEPA